jgi:hypothetical protein
VTEHQLDNIRIATRTLTYFVVSLVLYFVCSFVASFVLIRDKTVEEIYPYETSDTELFFSFLLFIPLFLAFILPVIVVIREFQNRKEWQNQKSILS